MTLSITTQVQIAIRALDLGDEFTARDIAEKTGVNAGAIGKILTKGVVGSEFAGFRKSVYKYSDGSTTHRGVRVYRRVATCPTS